MQNTLFIFFFLVGKDFTVREWVFRAEPQHHRVGSPPGSTEDNRGLEFQILQ